MLGSGSGLVPGSGSGVVLQPLTDLCVPRRPWVCGIASLGIDHTQILGDTIEKIAWQKAGILKVRLVLVGSR